jgi:hypothetical protein
MAENATAEAGIEYVRTAATDAGLTFAVAEATYQSAAVYELFDYGVSIYRSSFLPQVEAFIRGYRVRDARENLRHEVGLPDYNGVLIINNVDLDLLEEQIERFLEFIGNVEDNTVLPSMSSAQFMDMQCIAYMLGTWLDDRVRDREPEQNAD